jgi:uncharacterized LabA/DUF88 family protein
MENLSSSFENRRIAMLIDGENAQSSIIEKMLAETGKYGLVSVRRIYGDWTLPNMQSWKEVLAAHAIQPMQQFRNTVGKNSSDSALIIDAMDILYDGAVNGFCLVSSDSDFTRLATRIREKGFFVLGIGKENTPTAFVKACEVFVFTENLPGGKDEHKTHRLAEKKTGANSKPDPVPLLLKAFDMAVQEDGWAFLGTIGARLLQLESSFDTRTYGYKQLSQLIKANTDTFEVKANKGSGGTSSIYIRPKEEHSS